MYIKHLSHSGFLIQDGSTALIFDPITQIDPRELMGQTVFLISHSHRDHFNKDVLADFINNEKASFILSKDIDDVTPKSNMKNAIFLDNYETVKVGNTNVSAFGSTDRGNSYLVSLNGINYFHCGDLNWWHWENKMSRDELLLEEKNYKDEVQLLKGEHIDFAFVPVDPRLQDNAYLAINYFIHIVNPNYVIPMHSFGEYSFYKNLADNIDLQDTVLIVTSREGQIVFQD